MIGLFAGGRTSPIRLGGPLAIAFVALSNSHVALAADGDLQRVLLESGCINADIKTTLNKGKLVAYQANCLGSSHKVIEIICVGERCSANVRSTVRDD